MWVGVFAPSPQHMSRGKSSAAAKAVRTKGSAFSREPFTADMTIIGRQGTYHGKMYAGTDAMRTDVRLSSGVVASVIVRYDRGVEWILVPGRQYIEAPIDRSNDLLGALRDKDARVRKRDLGPERVGAYPCEKYRVVVSDRGRKRSGWIWVARAKAMNGFVVKAEDQSTGKSVVLSNVRFGSPGPSVFDLPAGYHLLTKPSKTPGPTH